MSFCLETKGRKIQEQRLGLAPPNHSVGFTYGTGLPLLFGSYRSQYRYGAVPKLTFARQSVDNS
ncbi:hypothetical protein [Riemerella anatipestifer]|uniref:hypothetical protein n=1 Tax=Riemerella anatipestifer TaxID=34085 RepID=UPI00111F01F6|nr:hypothetical protein [Riemerella anatipestifer]QDE20064.1 hypothetical protein FIP52_06550 [Riemerella anatipestifer]